MRRARAVCTSNKELVAEHGVELREVAREHSVNYLFEASCGGGIPIIRVLNTSLTAEEIEEVTGILNGTTNYILTSMADEGKEFDDALKEAQKMGYAELHPEADIEGWDACRKIAILSSLAYGNHISYKDVPTEGITHVDKTDIEYAKALGCRIKLLATSRRDENGTWALVAPMMIGKENPLTAVDGVMNAVMVKGNAVGTTMYYGSGAGSLPTASAVCGDVIDCVKHRRTTIRTDYSAEPLMLIPVDEVTRPFFVRMRGGQGSGRPLRTGDPILQLDASSGDEDRLIPHGDDAREGVQGAAAGRIRRHQLVQTRQERGGGRGMKYVLVLGDGMADEPVEALGGLTPLAYAKTPEMDDLASKGEIGIVHTIPEGMKPGSDTANLSVLGYDAKRFYSGRSPLEALSIGVPMKDTDISYRVNIVTLDEAEPFEKKTILDHSSSEISTEDSTVLLKAVLERGTRERRWSCHSPMTTWAR